MAWEANRLVVKRAIHPLLSETYLLEDTGEAALQVYHNKQIGKIGVLCLAPPGWLGRQRRRGPGAAHRADHPVSECGQGRVPPGENRALKSPCPLPWAVLFLAHVVCHCPPGQRRRR